MKCHELQNLISNIVHLYVTFHESCLSIRKFPHKEVSPLKQNDFFFTLQRQAVRDFWFVKLNASLRTFTLDEEVLNFR